MTPPRHELADQVVILLQRAFPGELTKEQLEEEAGLSPQDLRACVESLREAGELDDDAEHFRWRDPDEKALPADGEDGAEPAGEDDPHPAIAAQAELPSHGGASTRVVLEVVGSFDPGRGGNDEANIKRAQKIAEEIDTAINSVMPGLGANVFVRRVEAFDKVRVLFDADVKEDPDDN